MLPFSLAHRVRRLATAPRHTTLRIEQLEARDLLSYTVFAPPPLAGPPPHGPPPPTMQAGWGGEPDHAAPRPDFDILFASVPVPAPETPNHAPPPSEIGPPPTVVGNAALTVVGQPMADARNVAIIPIPVVNLPRSVVGTLASVSVGAASDARSVWTVAAAMVRGPAMVIDIPAAVLPGAADAPGLNRVADTASNLVLPLTATPQAPVLADLLTPTAMSSGPLIALQKLWPTEAEPDAASLLTRVLRSPYLPGAVVVLGALELFRRRLRRRRMATELPEITGPVGL